MQQAQRKGHQTETLNFVQNATLDRRPLVSDIDPDLSREEEIVLPRASAKTRTTVSGKSRRTGHSNKASEKSENLVRSRGRPMKPHEVSCLESMVIE